MVAMPGRLDPLQSRVLVFELDSERQAARYVDAQSPGDATRDILRIVRTALLVADRIAVTDAMLLDGMFFAHMPPEDLAAALGLHVSELPLEIISTGGSLADTLATKRRDRTFIWQIEQSLDRRRRIDHWDAWVAAAGMLRIHTAERFVSRVHEDGVESPFRPPNAEWVAGLSDVAQAHLADIRGRAGRSEVHLLSDAVQRRYPSDHGLAQVRQWWDDAYLVAIAHANSADWLRFDARVQGTDGLNPVAAKHRRRLRIPESLVTLAGSVPGGIYSEMRFVSAAQRRALHRHPSAVRVRNLAFTASRLAEGESRPVTILGAVGRLMVGVAAALIALPIFGESGWQWAAIGAGAIATIPWDAVWVAIKTWWDGRGPLVSIRIDGEDER